jgi:hypothetical protein
VRLQDHITYLQRSNNPNLDIGNPVPVRVALKKTVRETELAIHIGERRHFRRMLST